MMKEVIKENTEEEKMKKQEEKTDDIQEETKTEKEKEKKVEEKKFEKVEGKLQKVKKTVNSMCEEKKKKKWIIPVMIVIILLIAIMFTSTIFALVNLNNEKIIGGVSIAGVDVSGLTKEEAMARINEIYQPKKEKEITIEYEDYETTINPTVIEIDYKIQEAVEEAFLIGRGKNIFINNYHILSTLLGKRNILVKMTLNEEVAKQTIEDIGVNLPGVLLESSYAIEEDELIITKGKEGVVINTEELLRKIKENLSSIDNKEEFLEIPVEQKEPTPIDIDKIHEEVYTEAKDAYYTKDPFTIYPEVEGIDFDVEAARKLLQEEKEEYVIKLTITKPKITIDKIGSEAFPDQLATFTTRYDVSDRDRSTNLVIACQKINGKVVLAGETFSYNKALGPRTAAAGYRNGKIYSGGEVVDGIGGGICQISSTLYNTVLMSNLEIVERRNHQFVTSYVPAGRDATVVYGVTDFKFKNTRNYPIRIVATAKNGIATVTIYGIKEDNEYTFTFSTKTVASIPFTTKYEEDSSLPAGTEKIKQKGVNGLKTETYMTKLLKGKPVSTILLSRDTYDAMARTIIKGTNTTVTNEPTPPEVTNPTPEPEPTTPTQPSNPTESSEEKPAESTKPVEGTND